MKFLRSPLLAPAVLVLALAGGQASAESTKGNPGTGETPRSVAPIDLAKRKVVKQAPLKVDDDEASRGAPPADLGAIHGFKTRTKAKDGTVSEKPANEELKKAIEEEMKAQSGGAAQAEPPSGEAEPGLGEEASRQVFGDDDRVQVTDTANYPYRAIGQLWSQAPNGDWSTCTATLIGSKTVVTAAHCLYSHDKGGWLNNYEFYPGLNGPEDAPYGYAGFETVSILDGYISNYQGYYGSVVPWDLGVVVLDKQVGDDLGWFGSAGSDRMRSFTANIVGYPGDKPASTMWQATCEANAKDGDVNTFDYLCDTYPGSSGSAVYEYNPTTQERTIIGINVAESETSNRAVRFNRAYFQWVQSLIK
jgi:glutamyl endopeptidase